MFYYLTRFYLDIDALDDSSTILTIVSFTCTAKVSLESDNLFHVCL